MLVLRRLMVAFVLLGTFVGTVAAATGTARAEARSLVVYPFSSQETLLGAAVADRVAEALEGRLEVIGPGLAPLFVPFLATEEGFLSPLALLSPPFGVASPAGATLLRESLGVGAAVSGEVIVRDARLELVLYLSAQGLSRRYLFSASQEAPGRLAAQAVRVLEEVMGLGREPAETAPSLSTLDLSTAYADYVRALVLLGAGFAGEAAEALEQALGAAEPGAVAAGDLARWQRLLDEIRTVQEGGEAADPYLQAALALSLADIGERGAEAAFRRLGEATDLPAADLWVALLRRSQGLVDEADEAFERAAAYPFGAAAQALSLAGREAERARDLLAALGEAPMAATLAASLAAFELGDVALEAALLERLGRLAPTLVYPFERRSDLAFEQDEPLAAAQALVVATRLAPGDDRLWTNLGWAYYLLGFLDRSEEASLRALAIDDLQVVAWYNLGLVEVVTGRLAEAVASYDAALLRDEGVNAEAIEDLEEALRLFPDEPGVHFALASLYAAAGRRAEAAEQFERYLGRGDDPRFLAEAERRLTVLSAPPPGFTLGESGLSLRPGAAAETVYRRGDRLFPRLEVATEGFELPGELDIDLRVLDAAGEVVAESAARRDVPAGAVALRLDDLGVSLPGELAEGDYRLEVVVTASEAREARREFPFEVRGEASLTRQLVSRGISLRALEGAPLLPAAALAQEDDAGLIAALQAELAQTAELAEEVLPEVGSGRFEGLSGGALFRETSEADLRDFLRFVVAQEGLMETAFTFVDAYAQWALEGAPAP